MSAPPEARWLWNGDLQPNVLEEQIAAIRRHGFRSVVIWPWAGLEVPLGSAHFLEAIQVACRSAAANDLTLWLADDLSWPSGTAAGALLAAHPEAAQRVLVCTSRLVGREESRRVKWRGEGERLLLALGLESAGSRLDLAGALEERGAPVTEHRVSHYGEHQREWEADLWEAELRLPPGTWFVLVATVVRAKPLLPSTCGVTWADHVLGTLDVLSASSVQQFLDFAPARLIETAGPWLGRSVAGIVTSPASVLAAHPIAAPDGWRADLFPWFEDLPARLAERTAAPFPLWLAERIGALYEDATGGDDPAAPIAELATARAAETFAGTYRAWCKARGLALQIVEPHLLPAIPYTLKADRKRSILPSALVALHASHPSPQTGEARPRARGLGALPLISLGVSDELWTPLAELQSVWAWQPHSANVHPLSGWTVRRAGSRTGDDLHVAARFDAEYLPDDLALVFERGVVRELLVNGWHVALDAAAPPTEVEGPDPCLVGLPLAAARLGVNDIEATIVVPQGERIAFHGVPVLGPTFVAGTFALRDADGDLVIVRPRGEMPEGDWSVHGYPRFTGSASYRQSFVLAALPANAAIRLVVHAHGRAGVTLNERWLGLSSETPCVFDVRDALRPGINELAIVVFNHLGARIAGGGPSGLLGARLEQRRLSGSY